MRSHLREVSINEVRDRADFTAENSIYSPQNSSAT
jgi:hypothetical protein